MQPSQLKALRLSWGLSPAEMAKLCKCTLNDYARIEQAGVRKSLNGEGFVSWLTALDASPAYRAAMMRERGITTRPGAG